MIGIETSDGLRLEAAWTEAGVPPRGVVVMCHAHPLRGGSMRNPLMRGVARGLARSGFHVLRFNFRGVGHSDGAWGGGDPEIDDAAAAVKDAASTYPDLPMAVVGWSFGAVTALRWQARDGSSAQYAGIAPVIGPVSMVRPPVAALAPANRLLVIGDRDQFTPVRAVAEYGKAIGARVEIIHGSDHFFYFRHDRLASLVAAHFNQQTEDA